jgi:hypothetical protein
MSDWSFDITKAPRGKTVKSEQVRCSSKGEVTVTTEQFIPDYIWAACRDGKVYKTHWLPAGKERSEGRWCFLHSKEEPVAWQPFVVPAHPGMEG